MNKSKTKVDIDLDASFNDLFDRVRSDAGLIFVDTPEETRLIRAVLRKFKTHNVQFWSINQGLIAIPSDQIPDRFLPHEFPSTKSRNAGEGKPSKGNLVFTFDIIENDCRDKIKSDSTTIKNIYILRDADKYFVQPGPLRACRDLIYLASCAGTSIIITGFGLKVPDDLEKDSSYLKIPFPTTDEIQHGILPDLKGKIELHNKIYTSATIDASFSDDEVARACTGLTTDQIINTLGLSTTRSRKIDIEFILSEKKAIINKSDILDYWVCSSGLKDVGGFDELKKWFAIRKTVMSSPNAKAFRTKAPKGIMLLGLQSSGKTYIAKSLAQDWGVGTIKLEMGKIFAGLVGESEKRMRQALRQVEAVAPVIVIVDEIDKGLSGAGSSDRTDGGTTSRVIGTLLTWLQEDHPGVFLIATANDITALRHNHPELLRKGRFDEIWFSDAPTKEERKEIFKIHLNNRGRNPERFDLDKLAEYQYNSNGSLYPVTGAEIEYAIDDSLLHVFAKQQGKEIEINSKDDVQTDDILELLQVIKPISFIAKDTIQSMRSWSVINARNVSSSTDKIEKKKSEKGTLNLRSVTDIDI